MKRKKIELTINELMQLFPGWENKTLPEFKYKIEVFKRQGIDLVKVAKIALKTLNTQIQSAPWLVRTLVNCPEISSVAATIGILFQQVWVDTLNKLYPKFKFMLVGGDKPDIVCVSLPELNHELKTSMKLPISRNKGKYRFDLSIEKVYAPSCTEHLNNTEQTIHSKKDPTENIFIHIKINPIHNINENFRLNCVQGLVLQPGDVSDRGKISADIIEKQSMVLYEDPKYLAESYMFVCSENAKLGKTTKNEVIHEYFMKNRWDKLTFDEKLNLPSTDKAFYDYVRTHGWYNEIIEYRKNQKDNQLSKRTVELVNYVKINKGYDGLSVYDKLLYQFKRLKTNSFNYHWTSADIKYITEQLGTPEEQCEKYGCSLIRHYA